MISFYPSQALFEALKARSNESNNNGWQEADSCLQLILAQLNNFDNIVTIFSCEGHNNKVNELTSDVYNIFPYLMFVVKNIDGLRQLFSMFNILQNMISNNKTSEVDINELITLLSLESTVLDSATIMKDPFISNTDIVSSIPSFLTVYKLRLDSTDSLYKYVFIDSLTKAVNIANTLKITI